MIVRSVRACAAAAAVMTVIGAAGVAAAADLKIGVVDVAKVFEEYKKSMDARVALEQKKGDIERELKKREGALQALEEEMKIVAEQSDAMERLKKKYKDAQNEYRAYYKVQKDVLDQKTMQLTRQIYEQIVAEISAFSKQGGFSIVLKVESEPIEAESLKELQFRINERKVLYFTPETDLTAKILEKLNAKYDQEAKQPKETGEQ